MRGKSVKKTASRARRSQPETLSGTHVARPVVGVGETQRTRMLVRPPPPRVFQANMPPTYFDPAFPPLALKDTAE